MSDNDDGPFEFPCEFPIKAMGAAAGGAMPDTVLGIVRRHAPEADAKRMHVNESRNGNYVAVTVTITATSRSQLDAIYEALNGHEDVLMTL